MKTKTKLILISMIGLLLIVAITSQVIPKEESKGGASYLAKLSDSERAFLQEKYNARSYVLNKCWWKGNIYFCDIKIGNLVYFNYVITANINADTTIQKINQDCINEINKKKKLIDNDRDAGGLAYQKCYETTTLKLEELIDLKVTELIKGVAKDGQKTASASTVVDTNMSGKQRDFDTGRLTPIPK